MARDYVPHNAAQFNFFMKNLLDYVAQKSAEWAALRWQNERGILGAWSDIKDAIVP
jgi:hypothetical protein